ncbi:hypothetical protein [Cecembia calidifontis]|uniref:6-bladed beta-propeller protein n=1 Tax=Cecembia calidifontis TaxID=1187080 RepID=A0A4Q7P5A3_9BACT|nr:hypothetical protein [Cecembia calidifontis]RZS94887.1 hypothetical protein BC751_0398 [Cecembia calidifontis]
MKRFILITLCFLSGIFLTACNDRSELKDDKTNQIHEDIVFRFQENFSPIAPIVSFDFVGNERLVVITEKNQLILYDNSGKQSKIIDIHGAGQFEMMNPSIVKKFQDHFFVWCTDLLKIVQFDNEGNPVDEYLGFDHAIRDFSVSKDHIITYIPNITHQHYIQVFQKSPFKKVKEFGYVENEQVLLNFNACSGAMDIWNNMLLYAPSHSLRIHNLDLDRMVDDKIIFLEDEKFKVEKLEQDAKTIMNQDRIKALEYGLKNSILKGIYILDNFFVLLAEVGQIELNNFQPISLDREELVLVLDRNFNLVKKINLPFEFNKPCNLIRSYDNNYNTPHLLDQKYQLLS